MWIFAIFLVLVPLYVEGVTMDVIQAMIRQEVKRQIRQKDLLHEHELARVNVIISALQVKNLLKKLLQSNNI